MSLALAANVLTVQALKYFREHSVSFGKRANKISTRRSVCIEALSGSQIRWEIDFRCFPCDINFEGNRGAQRATDNITRLGVVICMNSPGCFCFPGELYDGIGIDPSDGARDSPHNSPGTH